MSYAVDTIETDFVTVGFCLLPFYREMAGFNFGLVLSSQANIHS